MSDLPAKQPAPDLYFEDIEVGASFDVPGRAVTEADLEQFANISGDHHPIHTDEEYARTTIFGRRIAHGPLGVALAIGMFAKLREFHKATMAMTDIREWNFRAPVFIGDRLSLEVTIAAKRRRRDASGIVERRMRLRNQDGTIVQEGLSGLLMACRMAADARPSDAERRNQLLNDELGLDH